MPHLGSRTARRAVLVTAALALILPLLGTVTSAAAPSEDDPRAEQAKAALARVQELLADQPGKAAEALSRHEAPDVSMAMRDLFLYKDALSGKDREQADRVLARPTNDSLFPKNEPKYAGTVITECSAVVCVHHVEGGTHGSDSFFADAVLQAATTSHDKMLSFGYRAPLPDGTKGSDSTSPTDRDLPDIYLANIGGAFGYGYAVPEKMASGWGSSGYVVLDNNYTEFCDGGCSPEDAIALMRATAAHEYFHAVQFGYDVAEDGWFMEATATWIEDEIFDGVNDNVNFLFTSPSALQTPHVPIDHKNAVPYGNWIWFRYLSERFGPEVVRKAWNKADGYTGGGRNPADKYSAKAVIKAVKAVSGKRGKKFWNKEFARFADANQRPKRYYDEARATNYPKAPRAGRAVLTKSKRTKVRETKLSRLASATYRVKPHRSLRKGWKLRVVVEGNKAKQGGFAIATIKRKGGGIKRVGFNLGRNGRKAKTLPFGRAKVRWIDVTIVSASTRNRCWLADDWKYDNYSKWADNTCKGKSKDNGRSQRLTVRAIR